MSASEIAAIIVSAVISAVVGGSGIAGIIFYFIRKRLERMLDGRDAEERKRRENRIKRASYNDALQHAQGRLLFWLYQAVVKGEHNGELDQAFDNFQAAEQRIKDHDRHIVAEQEGD